MRIFKGRARKEDFWNELWKSRIDSKINFILMLGTYALIGISMFQTCESKKSTKAAIEAVDYARKSYELSVRQQEENNREARKRFKMDSEYFEHQIKILDSVVAELKSQFEIENKSYLSFSLVKFQRKTPTSLRVDYKIYNHGNYPVHLITSRHAVLLERRGLENVDFDETLKGAKSRSINIVVNKTNVPSLGFDLVSTEGDIDELEGGIKGFVFLILQIEYYNLFDQSKGEYNVIVQFFGSDQFIAYPQP